SLAVGDITCVAEYTRERTVSTRPEASANGVTAAAPRNPVITSASVWNAMLVASAPMNANPPYEAINRRRSFVTPARRSRTPGIRRRAHSHDATWPHTFMISDAHAR